MELTAEFAKKFTKHITTQAVGAFVLGGALLYGMLLGGWLMASEDCEKKGCAKKKYGKTIEIADTVRVTLCHEHEEDLRRSEIVAEERNDQRRFALNQSIDLYELNGGVDERRSLVIRSNAIKNLEEDIVRRASFAEKVLNWLAIPAAPAPPEPEPEPWPVAPDDVPPAGPPPAADPEKV